MAVPDFKHKTAIEPQFQLCCNPKKINDSTARFDWARRLCATIDCKHAPYAPNPMPTHTDVCLFPPRLGDAFHYHRICANNPQIGSFDPFYLFRTTNLTEK